MKIPFSRTSNKQSAPKSPMPGSVRGSNGSTGVRSACRTAKPESAIEEHAASSTVRQPSLPLPESTDSRGSPSPNTGTGEQADMFFDPGRPEAVKGMMLPGIQRTISPVGNLDETEPMERSTGKSAQRTPWPIFTGMRIAAPAIRLFPPPDSMKDSGVASPEATPSARLHRQDIGDVPSQFRNRPSTRFHDCSHAISSTDIS